MTRLLDPVDGKTSVAAQRVSSFHFLATQLMGCWAPDLVAAPWPLPHKRRPRPKHRHEPAPPRSLAELIEIIRAAPWSARCRLACFLSDVPEDVVQALGDTDRAALADAHRRLGMSDELLATVRRYNAALAPYLVELKGLAQEVPRPLTDRPAFDAELLRTERAEGWDAARDELRQALRAARLRMHGLPDDAATPAPSWIEAPTDAANDPGDELPTDSDDAASLGVVPQYVTATSAANAFATMITAPQEVGLVGGFAQLLPQPATDVMWLLDPTTWPLHIVGMVGVTRPSQGALYDEEVSLLPPFRAEGLVVCARLIVTSTSDTTSDGLQRRWLRYRLQPPASAAAAPPSNNGLGAGVTSIVAGGDNLLTCDDGFILVADLGDGTTYLQLSKTVVAPDSPAALAELQQVNPQCLNQMLAAWAQAAER